MKKTYAEIERLKKAMDEEHVNHVSVSRHDHFDKDGNREKSRFSVNVSIYDTFIRPSYMHNAEDDPD